MIINKAHAGKMDNVIVMLKALLRIYAKTTGNSLVEIVKHWLSLFIITSTPNYQMEFLYV